jgi:hypothetical protein
MTSSASSVSIRPAAAQEALVGLFAVAAVAVGVAGAWVTGQSVLPP